MNDSVSGVGDIGLWRTYPKLSRTSLAGATPARRSHGPGGEMARTAPSLPSRFESGPQPAQIDIIENPLYT